MVMFSPLKFNLCFQSSKLPQLENVVFYVYNLFSPLLMTYFTLLSLKSMGKLCLFQSLQDLAINMLISNLPFQILPSAFFPPVLNLKNVFYRHIFTY